MKQVITFKIPWKTNHFNKGQNVFIEYMSGNQACKCRGKFRGKNRMISAWFKWNDKNFHLLHFKKIDLNEIDYTKIMGTYNKKP